MKEYRFKTLEEFGGERPFRWNDKGKMDYLLGQKIPKDLQEKINSYLKKGYFLDLEKSFPIERPFGYWNIYFGDLVEIKSEKQEGLEIVENGLFE